MSRWRLASPFARVQSHPSVARAIRSLEFFPTNGPEDSGNLFIQTNPLKYVHIVDTSVSKLLMAEGLIPLHLLGATEGNVVAVRGHRNVIMCRTADRPPGLVW
jgi:hypothetical protein